MKEKNMLMSSIRRTAVLFGSIVSLHRLVLMIIVFSFLASTWFLPSKAIATQTEWADSYQTFAKGRLLMADDDLPTLTEYFGLDCPPCRSYASNTFPDVFKQLVAEGIINYRVKHFPLSTRGSTLDAHNALECASDQNRFWPMKLLLVNEGGSLESHDDYVKRAEQAKVADLDRFRECMETRKHVDEIRNEKETAREKGIRAIPTFSLEGTRWSGAQGSDVQIRKIKSLVSSQAVSAGKHKQKKKAGQPNHKIYDIEFDPESPAKLVPGERLEFGFRFDNDSDTRVQIWGRPYTDGHRTSGYRAHGSSRYDPGQGSDKGFFYFDRETEVDEVRFMMRTAGSRELVHEETRSVNYRWRKPRSTRPALSGTENDTVEVRFVTGRSLFQSLKEDIVLADSSVRMFKIVYPLDETEPETSPGRQMARLLVKKARKGVSVEILTSGSNASILSRNTVPAEEYFSSTPVEYQREATLDQLNVNGTDWLKSQPASDVVYGQAVLIDGEILYLGNFVLSSNDLGGPNSPGLRLTGEGIRPTVHVLERLFKEHFGPDIPSWDTPEPTELSDFDIHFSEDISERLVEMIDSANRRIDMGMYRFHPTRYEVARPVLKALVNAHRRGVDLNLALGQPNRGEQSPSVQFLRKKGIPVYLYDHPDDQYHRFMVVDGEQVYLGSQKLSHELTGRGYGFSFTGRSRVLGGQIQSYLEYWLKQSTKLPGKDNSESSASTDPEPSRSDKELQWEELRKGTLPALDSPKDPSRPLLTRRLDESDIQQAREKFQVFKHRSEGGLRVGNIGINVRSASQHHLNGGILLSLRKSIPEYSTLMFRNLVGVSPISKIHWESIINSRTGESLSLSDQNQQRTRLDSIFYRNIFRERLYLPQINQPLRATGVHSYFLPTEVEAYHWDPEGGEPWTVPGTGISIKSQHNQSHSRLTVEPAPSGSVLGVIGFDTAGERVHGSSHFERLLGDTTVVKVRFFDPVDELIVLRVKDYRVESQPFSLDFEPRTLTLSLHPGHQFTLGNQQFTVDEFEYAPEGDTTRIKVTSDSSTRSNLLGLLAYGSDSSPLNYQRFSRGTGGDGFSQEQVFRGKVERIAAVTLQNEFIRPVRVEKVPGNFEEQLFQTPSADNLALKVKDATIDTGPYHFQVTLHLDAEELEKLRRVYGIPDMERIRPFQVIGEAWKTIEPGQSSVSFRFEGVNHPDLSTPHIRGFTLMDAMTRGYQPIYTLASVSHDFQSIQLYHGDRPADTSVNDLTVESLETKTDPSVLSVDVDYRSDHGQHIVVMAITGGLDGLGVMRRTMGFWGTRLLRTPRQRVRLPLTPTDIKDRSLSDLEDETLTVFIFNPNTLPDVRNMSADDFSFNPLAIEEIEIEELMK